MIERWRNGILNVKTNFSFWVFHTDERHAKIFIGRLFAGSPMKSCKKYYTDFILYVNMKKFGKSNPFSVPIHILSDFAAYSGHGDELFNRCFPDFFDTFKVL